MEQEYTMELYMTLTEELREISEIEIRLMQKLARSLDCIRTKIRQLENHLTDYPFQDLKQEAAYFKTTYPQFQGLLIFYAERFNLEMNKPLLAKAQYTCYLSEELKIIDRFFNQNLFLYNYYLLNSEELDMIYFVRRSDQISYLLPENAIADPRNSTQASIVFSKIVAYQKLKYYIREQLDSLASDQDPNFHHNQLRWTGDSINLLEVAYGLCLTGQINHGNATVTEIVEWLEAHLGIKIGRPARRWQEIAQRKTISPSKYTEEMASAIRNRLDSELGR